MRHDDPRSRLYRAAAARWGGLALRATTPPESFGRRPLDAASPVDETEQAVLDGGPYVSAETSRRLACDAALVVMRHAPDGSVLDVGRKTRTIPSAIRRALTARDPRCRFPGCTGRRVRDTSALTPTTERLTSAGIVIGSRTGYPQWYGERFDVGHAIDVLRQDEERLRPPS